MNPVKDPLQKKTSQNYCACFIFCFSRRRTQNIVPWLAPIPFVKVFRATLSCAFLFFSALTYFCPSLPKLVWPRISINGSLWGVALLSYPTYKINSNRKPLIRPDRSIKRCVKRAWCEYISELKRVQGKDTISVYSSHSINRPLTQDNLLPHVTK